jgi:archaellum component FlaC
LTTINNNNSKDDRDVQVHNENRLLDHVAELSNIDHREANRQNKEANIQSSLALSPAVEELFKKSPFQQICEEINNISNILANAVNDFDGVGINFKDIQKSLKKLEKATEKLEGQGEITQDDAEEVRKQTQEAVKQLNTYTNTRNSKELNELLSIRIEEDKQVHEHEEFNIIVEDSLQKISDKARIYFYLLIQYTSQRGNKSKKGQEIEDIIRLELEPRDIDKLMKLRGFDPRRKKEFMQELEQGIKAMYNLSLSWKDGTADASYRLVAGIYVDVEERRAVIEYTPQFYCKMFVSQGWQPTSDLIFLIDIKTKPQSFYYNKAIEDNKNINYGKKNANIISVLKLLNADPKTKIITSEMKRKWKERLLKRFKKGMDELINLGILASWEFTDGEPKNYTEFINSNIQYEIINYPPKKQKNTKTETNNTGIIDV